MFDEVIDEDALGKGIAFCEELFYFGKASFLRVSFLCSVDEVLVEGVADKVGVLFCPGSIF